MRRTFRKTVSAVLLACFTFVFSASAQDFIKEGESFYIKGRYDEALSAWRKAAEADPGNLVIEKYMDLARERLKGESLEIEKEKTESIETRKEDARRAKWSAFLTRLTEKLKLQDELPGPTMETIITREKGVLSLQDCVDIALDNDIGLQVAKKQLKLAKIRVWEARRKMGPELTMKWEETKGQVQSRHYEGRKIYFEGKQPVFYGGELYYGVKQSETNLEVVRNDYQRIKDEKVLDVKKAYYSLDKAVKAIPIQEKLYNNSKRLYDVIKKQHDEKVVPEVEYLNVLSKYNMAEFHYISVKDDVQVALLILQQAMNTEREFEIVPVEDPKIIDIDLEDCYALAYLNNPKIKINLLMQDYYTFEKRIARAKGWPKIDFMGSYGRAYEQYVDRDLAGAYVDASGNADIQHTRWESSEAKRKMEEQWYLGFKASMPMWGNTLSYSQTKEVWPPVVSAFRGTESTTHLTSLSLLDDLEYFSGKEESDISFERAQQELLKTKQEVSLDIKETFFKYKKSVLQMKLAKSRVAYQDTNVKVLEERRKFGETETSELMEEMIKLAEDEFSYLQAMADYYIAIVGLNKAIGLEEYFQI